MALCIRKFYEYYDLWFKIVRKPQLSYISELSLSPMQCKEDFNEITQIVNDNYQEIAHRKKIDLQKLNAEYAEGRVNQRVQHYEIFLKKTSAGVEKLSFSLGLALIFFLILVIFPSVTVLMSVPFGIYCRISLLPFSMAPFCHAQ